MTETYVFDPFAPGYTDDPYPEYARLRASGAAHEHPLGFWVLSHHEDVSALLRGSLSVEERNVGGALADLNAEMYGEREERSGGLSMLDRDPPVHTRLRKLVSKAFTPRSIAALEPEIVSLVDELLDRMSGPVDLVEALAFPLPFAVISQMMGLPDSADHARMRELTGTLVRSLEPVVDPQVAAEIMAADEELSALARGLIAWKRANPGEDLMTALIRAEDDGDVLDDDELVAQVVLLYVAGHETTVNLIANGALALLHHPDQAAMLREQPDLAGNAVEELLRYDSPVQFSRRITLAPYEVDGRTIPQGSFVMAGLGAANRDEAQWGPDADQLRIDRPEPRSHLSFGAGVHHCLGAALARLEGRIAIQRLVERFPRLALDGDVEWNGRINLRGPNTLPVTTG
ncbi:cytochrome P450 [Nocardioides panacisoli]|uniref:Cytochrome P450 n=1 Tax=Nocardioides panacisoli TaxID=627624 RepID=A0ABP7IN57_9ACTN